MMMRFVIYGAQAIALGVCRAFDTLFKDIEIPCFLVTERGINPERLAGRPVMELPGDAESDEGDPAGGHGCHRGGS